MFVARRISPILAFLSLAAVSVSSAEAQLVQIGPFGGFRLRAPLVSVDVAPGGATSVRAPFTAVDTPGYPYGGYPYDARYYGRRAVVIGGPRVYLPRPLLAPAQEPIAAYRPATRIPATRSAATESTEDVAASAVQRLSDEQLWRELAEASDAFARGLQAHPEGEVWLNFLRPDQIIALAQQGDLGALRELLNSYDGTHSNRELNWVSNTTGFQATRGLLREWLHRQRDVRQPDVRQRDVRQQPDVPAPNETETIPLPAPDAEPVRIEA